MGNKRNKKPKKRRCQEQRNDNNMKKKKVIERNTDEGLCSSVTLQRLENVSPMELSILSDLPTLAHTQHNTPLISASNENLPCDNIPPDDLPDLEVEGQSNQPSEVQKKNIGRRIISVSHFYKKLQEISMHGPLGCSLAHIDLIGETNHGLTSKFKLHCRLCNLTFFVESDSNDDHYLPINTCAVAGVVSIGGGHSHLQEITAAMNLPSISNKTYQNIHEVLSKNWEEVAQETMEQAAKEERDIAITQKRFSKNGVPIIDVCADGCYSKRSYKTNYSSLSGAGAIVGKNTGKILYLGIRNKYCYICDRAEKRKTNIKEHKCFRNYTGPSTGMESDIIVEGFKQSVQTHNLIYGRLISDGDSSTYSKILQMRPYHEEGITVEKIECRNHLLRNFCNKLNHLKKDTRFLIKDRKQLTKNRLKAIRKVITKAISANKNHECPDVERLFDDILLVHHHAFGHHTNCKSYFCQNNGTPDDNAVPAEFMSSSLWQRISLLVQQLAPHARSLIHDVDSNIVEQYHSIVAKYIGGKRINFSLKQSYATRCKAAALAYNTNKSLSRLYKHMSSESPQGRLKMLEDQRIKKKMLNKKNKVKRRRLVFTKRDENYGEQCIRPDVPEEEFEKMKITFLKSLEKSEKDRQSIEKKTILQRDSSEWLELRRSLLTASNFGRVIRKRTSTGANLIKDILYKKNLDHVASIKHGLTYERVALEQLETQEGLKIKPCGLFIDPELAFLGATPDGVIDEDTIVEIKCPKTAHEIGFDKAIRSKKVNFWTIDKQGQQKINKAHKWFYQVQGQLHITGRKQCIFAVWSNHKEKLKIEIIPRDDVFWENKMKSQLESFYKNYLLPEIVDPRFTRNLPIREPEQKKQNNVQKKKKNNKKKSVAAIENLVPQINSVSEPTCSRYLDFTEL